MSLRIINVHLAYDGADSSKLFTLRCVGGRITQIKEFLGGDETIVGSDAVDGRGGLLLPSLCHSHIHLDKCYILDKGPPLVAGDFQEALEVTTKVKATFRENPKDLYDRGDRLIRASVEAGVTSMRAHVEVDTVVHDSCVLQLIVTFPVNSDESFPVFMQDPLFETTGDLVEGPNARIFEEILRSHSKDISAVGSAPYVEGAMALQEANIRNVLSYAIQHNLHADFHLDYDLSPLPHSPGSGRPPLIYYLVSQLKAFHWLDRMPKKTVAVGHATRLTLLSPSQLRDLRELIGNLPVYFVGLPQSDIYMMGRGQPDAPRGTLNVCRWRREYDFNVALAVNNVGNAFTPQGTPDPLSLCTLGAAIYQDATKDGCSILLKAVSVDSKRAIGDEDARAVVSSLAPSLGSPADFVILHDTQKLESAALEPSFDRTTIKAGRVVAWRKATRFIADESC